MPSPWMELKISGSPEGMRERSSDLSGGLSVIVGRREDGGFAGDGTDGVALDDGQGEVAAGRFEDAAGLVGGAAEAAGHGVREVDGDEDGVDVIHGPEDLFAAVVAAAAQPVEEHAAKLAHGLGDAVEVGREFDT